MLPIRVWLENGYRAPNDGSQVDADQETHDDVVLDESCDVGDAYAKDPVDDKKQGGLTVTAITGIDLSQNNET